MHLPWAWLSIKLDHSSATQLYKPGKGENNKTSLSFTCHLAFTDFEFLVFFFFFFKTKSTPIYQNTENPYGYIYGHGFSGEGYPKIYWHWLLGKNLDTTAL